MRTTSAPVRIVGSLTLALLFFSSPTVCAQGYYGLAGGLNYAGPAPDGQQGPQHYTRGFAVQTSVGRQFGDRLGARLDAFLNHFTVQQPPIAVGVMCPS